MITIRAKIRDKFGKKTRSIRKQGIIPAVLYGAEIKNFSLEINQKEFERVYQEAGKSSLISLEVGGKKFSVLIHQIARDPIKEEFLHVDFYHPSAKRKIEAEIPFVFEGEAPAVKELGGTLEKELSMIEVRGLVQDLPREIKVNVGSLKTFEDRILIRDLDVPEQVEVLKKSEEIIIHVTPPEKVEEELSIEGKEAGEEKEEEEKEENERPSEGIKKEEKTKKK